MIGVFVKFAVVIPDTIGERPARTFNRWHIAAVTYELLPGLWRILLLFAVVLNSGCRSLDRTLNELLGLQSAGNLTYHL